MKEHFAIRYKKQDISLKLLFIFCLFISNSALSQYNQLTPKAEISVLTIGPGSSLNDAFGHSAYRVKDSSLDAVFGYGEYDFNAPNFYLNFAQGKLNYKIGAVYFDGFKKSYIRQNRTIKEQVLDLSQQEKQLVFNYLSNNYEPENQYYLYDFFYNNCATKIKDVVVDVLDDNIQFNEPKSFKAKTFRALIHDNLDWNSWGSFGIDLALGSVIDRPATAEEHMFLPSYIHTFFETATIKNSLEKKLVKHENVIYNKTKSLQPNYFLSSPILVLGLIGLIIIYLTYLDYKKGKRSKWLDIILFISTGLIGIIILLLWFATDHEATAINYNLLWAFALNVFMIGQILKSKPKTWFIKYLKFLIIMLCLLTLHWLVGIQRFAFALIPLLIAILIRYIYLIKFYKKQIAN